MTRLDLCKCAYLLSSCNLGSKALNHGHGTTVKKPRLQNLELWKGSFDRAHSPFPHDVFHTSFQSLFLFGPYITWIIISYQYQLISMSKSVYLNLFYHHVLDVLAMNLLHEGPESVTWKAWICYIGPVGYVWPQHTLGFKEANSG